MGDLPSKKDLEAQGDAHGFRVNQRLLVGGSITLVLLIFILSNRQEVPVSFLTIKWNVPLWFVLAGTALLGAAAGALLTHLRQRRKARRA